MKALGKYWASLCLALVMQGGRALPFPAIRNLGPCAEQFDHWYSIRVVDSGDGPMLEALVYGEIGSYGVTAEHFIRDLKEQDDGASPVVVSFSTIGGDLMGGVLIHNALKDMGERCEGRIVGACYSAGTVAVSGAHRVTMADNGLYMIHNPNIDYLQGVDSAELRAYADLLDKTLDLIIACYRNKTINLSDEALKAMISATTWMNASEALTAGFVDEVLTGVTVKAALGNVKILNRYENTPPEALALVTNELPSDQPLEPEPEPEPVPEPAPEPEPEPEPELDIPALAAQLTADCAGAGLSNVASVLITASGLKSRAVVQEHFERAKAVKALCVLAKMPDEAVQLITDGLSEDQARVKLFDKVVANSNKVHISSQPPLPEHLPTPLAKAVDPGDVYERRKPKAS